MTFKRILKRGIFLLMPSTIRKQLLNFYILAVRYAQYKTIKNWTCVNSEGTLIPWYTYPAIEYLDNLDFSEKEIFEYGSGNSSVYWARQAKKVYSIEHNKDWYQKIINKITDNQSIELCESRDAYLNAIKKLPNRWDVIIIDGIHRDECARLVSSHLSSDGIVILDNAERHKETAKYLRDELDFLEVDFHGFGPINAYTWTTSIFFSRSAKLFPKMNSQPNYSIAGIKNDYV